MSKNVIVLVVLCLVASSQKYLVEAGKGFGDFGFFGAGRGTGADSVGVY